MPVEESECISHLRRRKQYEKFNLSQSSRHIYVQHTRARCGRNSLIAIIYLYPNNCENSVYFTLETLCVTMHYYNSHLIITRKQFYFIYFARRYYYGNLSISLIYVYVIRLKCKNRSRYFCKYFYLLI